MRLSRWFVFASVAGAIGATALEGCSDSSSSQGDLCKATASCTGAPVPTLDQENQCTVQLNEPQCGATFKAMKECLTFRAECRSDGEVNTSATAAKCTMETQAHNTCKKTPPDSGIVTDGCRPRTCAQTSANCGEIDNGCGAKLMCGTCTNGQTCGTNNRCGCTCDPTWCGMVVACGATITCPTTCVAPQFCGGGGVANRCGCLPTGNSGSLTATSITTATITLEAGSPTTWLSSANARVSDNSFATASMSTGVTTQYLVALTYGAALPATAVVEGIVVDVERASTGALATTDYAVQLVKNTTIQTAGDNKAAAGIVWPVAKATRSYGSATDKWGNTWTAADINAGGFGVAVAATYTGQVGSESARVDSIKVTVHYSGIVCN